MSLLPGLIAVVDSVTKNIGLQADVTHHVLVLPVSGDGDRDFTQVVRKAIVEKKRRVLQTLSGQLIQTQAKITFLSATIVIGPHDKLVLADGTTGPLLTNDGFVDEGNAQILTEVFLGQASGNN